MQESGYIQRRDEIQVYFDRTALDGWKRLTSDAAVSGIRATVRAGRERMRAAMLAALPADLSGWRILDAGCGAGQMSVALANRGASVLGVDLAGEMIRHAASNLPGIQGKGSVQLVAGDMLSTAHGQFDAVLAMDSLIHYQPSNTVDALLELASRTRRNIIFTVAPRTLPLSMMHMAGKLFPRGDRSPAIVPTSGARLLSDLMFRDGMDHWRGKIGERVNSGFYISQAMELSRT